MRELCLVCSWKMPYRPANDTEAGNTPMSNGNSSMLKPSVRLALRILRWLLSLGLFLWGAALTLWAYQSASFSVPAEFPMKAVYETRAMLSLPLGVLLIVVGVLLLVRPR